MLAIESEAASMQGVPERITARALPDVKGVLAVSVEGSSRCWREIHDAYMLCAVMPPTVGESRGTIRYGRWSYEIAPGQVLLMEPGGVHVTQVLRGTANLRLLRIDEDALRGLVGARDDSVLHFRQPFVVDPKLLSAVCEAHACFDEGAKGSTALGALSTILGRLIPIAAERQPRSPYNRGLRREVVRAMALLKDHHQEGLTLEELAQSVGLKPLWFDRLFSNEVGLAPMQYLKELRLNVARRKLALGSERLIDIAHDAGFYDQQQLCNMFKHSTGLSPGAFRRALRTEPRLRDRP